MAGLIEEIDIASSGLAEPDRDRRDSVENYPDRVFNFTVCILDWIGASVGLAFLSLTTIVPVFLRHLGANNQTIGLLPALLNLALQLPGIMVARRVSKMARVRGFLFRNAVLERLLLLPIGLLAPIWSLTHPKWMIVVTFAGFIGFGIFVGLNQAPYWTLFGKTIPVTWRGRLIGISGLVTGLMGLVAGVLINRMMSAPDGGFPSGFGHCFVIGNLILLSSVVCLGIVREPDSEPHADLVLADTHPFIRCAGIWRSDSRFRGFLFAQAAVSLGTLAAPFYVLYAENNLHAPSGSLGIYTSTLMLGTAAGGLLFGVLADRAGNRITYILAAILVLAAVSLALCVPHAGFFAAVFIATALADAAAQIAVSNMTIEMAPSTSEIPFYTSLAGIAMIPTRMLAPLAGGFFADHFGYRSTFLVAAVFAVAGVWFALRIQEPRPGIKFRIRRRSRAADDCL